MSNFNRRKPAYRKPSPNPTQSSPCPYSARCGVCSRVHIPYGEKL